MSGLILNSSGGGTINITAPNTANNVTLTLPTLSGGSLVTTDSNNNVTLTGSSTATAFIPSSSIVPTNGIFLPTANNIAIATGGTERIRINSSGLTFPDATSQNTGGYTGFRNRIINGAMVIDQRNAGASVTPTTLNGQYTFDRWNCNNSAASKYSVQQNAGSVTPPAGYKNYLGVTSLAATTVGSGDYYQIMQQIEGFNVADLAWGTASASTVTLSFWVRSSLTGTFGGSLNNSAENRSYPYSYTISSANTWEYKTITIAGDTTGTWLTDNGKGLTVRFSLGMGSTYSSTAGSWQSGIYASTTGATSVVGTNGATFYITGCQLEKGSVATPFEFRPYGTELQLCQRYYELCNYIAQADYYFNTIYFKVTKRAIPTLTKISGLYSPIVNPRSVNSFSQDGPVASADAVIYSATAEL